MRQHLLLSSCRKPILFLIFSTVRAEWAVRADRAVRAVWAEWAVWAVPADRAVLQEQLWVDFQTFLSSNLYFLRIFRISLFFFELCQMSMLLCESAMYQITRCLNKVVCKRESNRWDLERAMRQKKLLQTRTRRTNKQGKLYREEGRVCLLIWVVVQMKVPVLPLIQMKVTALPLRRHKNNQTPRGFIRPHPRNNTLGKSYH